MNRNNFESELDFQKSWSMKAGELSGLKTAQAVVMKAASDSFVAGRNDAITLRAIAQEIGKKVEHASSELQEYIDRGSWEKLID